MKQQKSKPLIFLQARIIFLFLSVIIILPSCGASEPRSESERFERNRDLWRKSKITNYKMTIQLQKSGHEGPRGVYTITVQDGSGTSITSPDPKMTDASNGARQYASIERLFNLIETSIKSKPDSLKVDYDPQYGYPKKMDLDRYLKGFDDEF